ncbi:glycosyltransferase family 4 protein [Microbacterium sp. NPDC089321]|uniref:glycosyltransferase family 4 protein n=1 Tax=Microbacterium sp. NPDC089321 TaxID=3155183 RepID=UPI00343CD6BA
MTVSDRFAGVEQFVRRLAAIQAADGHEVFVAGGDARRMTAPLREAGVSFTPARSLREALTAIRSADVDVVNSHMTAADTAAVVARLVTRRGPALVSTRHFALRRGSRGPSIAYRAVERLLDAEISISRAVAESIGVPSTIVHPGVDPVEVGESDRERTVLMAQRLQPEKDTAVGVRAFAASGLAAAGWRLEIAGTGPQEESLRALADDLGLGDAVAFRGFRDDLPELMRSAGMLLATSPFEHFGLTVLEAMASGLPVVASDAGGHSEMLRPLADAALYPPGDPVDAAALLSALSADAPRRARLGEAQRRRQLEAFTLRAQADATESVYRGAIAQRGGR